MENKKTTVIIKNHAFNPAETQVTAGQMVIWRNEDLVPHTVVSDPDGSIFKSGIIVYRTTTSFTFDKAGEYPYHCSIHPNMHGKVTVKE